LNSNAYSFLVHKSEILNIHVNMIIESRDVLFGYVFPYKWEENNASRKRIYETTFKDKGPSELTVNAEVEARSKRSRISKSFGPDFTTYALESEPQIFKKVMSTPESQIGKETINSKKKSILSNHTRN